MGYNVDVYEEHTTIGKPVQCTGLLTSSINKIIQIPEDLILNKISKARIYAPNNEYIDIHFKNPNFVIDRTQFDKYLAKLAEKAGAKYHLDTRFLDFKNKNITIQKNNKKKTKKTDILIGADGPHSTVAKLAGLMQHRKYWIGIQARVKSKQPNMIQFFPHIGTYAWIVPESKTIARVGVVLPQKQKLNFNKFLDEKTGNAKILSYNSGIIPKYNPNITTQKNNLFLIGDAAAQTKATTGGGIIKGLAAAECLAQSVKNNQDYQKICKNKIGFNLWIDLKIRGYLDKMKPEDYNYLIKLCKQKRVKKILEEIDREYPLKILFNILIQEPRFLYFIKLLF